MNLNTGENSVFDSESSIQNKLYNKIDYLKCSCSKSRPGGVRDAGRAAQLVDVHPARQQRVEVRFLLILPLRRSLIRAVLRVHQLVSQPRRAARAAPLLAASPHRNP